MMSDRTLQEGSREASAPPGQVSILLVDDRQDKLLAIETALSPLGQNLVTARSGREALKELLTRRFAVILLDVAMPGLNGFETAELIRQHPRSEHTPIIFITSMHASENSIQKGYSFGAVDYILSPIVPEVLRCKVSVFVELWKNAVHIQEQAEQLKEASTRLNLALRASQTRTWTLDLQTDEFAWDSNDGSRAATAVSLENFLRSVHEEDRQQVRQALLSSARQNSGFELEFRCRLSTKDFRVLIFRGTPVSVGGSAKLTGVAVDVTSLRETQVARERAEAETRAKDRFIAMLSHELRTPLTPVLMNLSTLKRDPSVSPRLLESLEMIERNVQMEARLIDDLLDISRITFGKIELQMERVDLHECIRNALNPVMPEIEGRKQKIILRLHARNQIIWGDSARLQQVFWNLLRNASKFTPAEGEISCETENVGSLIRVKVSDTGMGVSKENQCRIFEAFQQGEQPSEVGGLGLGLTISKAILEVHQGRLSLESRGKNQGSTFCVELETLPGEFKNCGDPAARESLQPA
jgi:signal transduction histidine kinase